MPFLFDLSYRKNRQHSSAPNVSQQYFVAGYRFESGDHRHSLYADKYLVATHCVVALRKPLALVGGDDFDLALCVAMWNVAKCCQSCDNVLNVATLALLVARVCERECFDWYSVLDVGLQHPSLV